MLTYSKIFLLCTLTRLAWKMYLFLSWFAFKTHNTVMCIMLYHCQILFLMWNILLKHNFDKQQRFQSFPIQVDMRSHGPGVLQIWPQSGLICPKGISSLNLAKTSELLTLKNCQAIVMLRSDPGLFFFSKDTYCKCSC